MKDLVQQGVITRIRHGVKILAKGAENFKQTGAKLDLEVTDASDMALKIIKEMGGSVKVEYRTPLLLRQHLKPHKFQPDRTLKTPMPPPKKVKKMEKQKDRGIEVNYPPAPWYTDNEEQIRAEEAKRQERIKTAQHSEHLEWYPAKRVPTPDRVLHEKEELAWNWTFQK